MVVHLGWGTWIKRLFLFFLAIVIASTVFAQGRPSTVKTLKVLGSAIFSSSNEAAGRQNAVDDALTAAVSQVVAGMLTSETVIRRFQLINDELLSKKENYVQNYRVLTESISGRRIRVFVQVNVAADQVGKDLSRLGLARTGIVYPRILFLVAERNVQQENFVYWWGSDAATGRTVSEAGMADALQQTGFKIAPTPALSEPLNLPLQLQDEQKTALANRLGADVLVVGSGSASTVAAADDGTKTIEAIVNATAFNVKTGQRIGQTRQKKVLSNQPEGKGGSQALAAAGAAAGERLSRQILAAWQQDLDSGAVLAVVVEGTDGHIASFVRLRKAITSLSGVRELRMKAISADRAEMDVYYQGSSRSLADALLMKTFEGFGIDILEVTAETVRIRLVQG